MLYKSQYRDLSRVRLEHKSGVPPCSVCPCQRGDNPVFNSKVRP